MLSFVHFTAHEKLPRCDGWLVQVGATGQWLVPAASTIPRDVELKEVLNYHYAYLTRRCAYLREKQDPRS